jgi:hypothetical protein
MRSIPEGLRHKVPSAELGAARLKLAELSADARLVPQTEFISVEAKESIFITDI